MSLTDVIQNLASIDIFKEGKDKDTFVGKPFYLDYQIASILITDIWKQKVKGIPLGTFLLAFYENEKEVEEALLLRALGPSKLPTDSSVVSSMIEYYKENIKTSGQDSQLDTFTRYEFSFSGLNCRILGTFYKNIKGNTVFGTDVENFYSSHNYSIYKPQGKVLEIIANLRSDTFLGKETDERIGYVRYSSTSRFQQGQDQVEVRISPDDFLGKRTALFGMTRTGKSNTVKKIIDATVKISDKAAHNIEIGIEDSDPNYPLDSSGIPKYQVGQIIFDINGEYANANPQDLGLAIFDKYEDRTVRYSVLNKPSFKVMKVNFYTDEELISGFSLIQNHFKEIGESSDYLNNFLSISLEKPDDYDTDFSVKNRYDRKVAAYRSCLFKAGFGEPTGFKVKFAGNKILNQFPSDTEPIEPDKGVSLEQSAIWFENIWKNYSNAFFERYKKEHQGKEWADEELKAILVFLTRIKKAGGTEPNISGYLKLRPLMKLHTKASQKPFEVEICELLRAGKIVILDLSQGDPEIQRLYSERITQKIFSNSMANFIENKPNNFVQFYFEEAHNLFPKKEDKDLNQIYNRLAKEGAKLNIGLLYATQEVSSISSNILKNTQNWFIAHLNNEDEIRELKKYYDFADFCDGLSRFSSEDRGFVRMKTYSNPFVVPVQIDRFIASK